MWYLASWFGMACLAAFVAHRKNRSEIGWFLLSVAAPVIGLLAAALVKARSERDNTNWVIFKLLLGFSPLWVAIAWVVSGSVTDHSPDYWNVAPWFIFAAIPVCGVSILVVELVAKLLSNVRGNF